MHDVKILIEEFSVLPHGYLIEQPDTIIRMFDIVESSHENHPHRNLRVYMSRRAIKHFVESRMKQLIVNHTHEESLQDMFFAFDVIDEVLIHYEVCEQNLGQRILYQRDYSHLDMPNVRVIVEPVQNGLEVVSIHFKKKTKRTNKNTTG
jgi:hypothetical protein